jgi:DNA repair exonuclease SbcCD nuclease subunit
MSKKILSYLGIVLLIFMIHSCTSHPEKTLLDRYFHAMDFNDSNTLSTMAIEPADFEFDSWEIVNVTEEYTETFELPELDKKGKELKKKLDDHTVETLNVRDEMDVAKFEMERRRTRANINKFNEAEEKYNKLYEENKELRKEYNETRDAADREEEIALFSLGGDFSQVRQFEGDVHKKEVEVKVQRNGEEAGYKIFMRRYILTNPETNITHTGRWIILRFEKLE